MIRQTRRARHAAAAASLAVLAIARGEASAQSAVNTRADSMIVSALERARSGDTTAAVRTLKRATKVAPKHAPAHYHLGVMLSRGTQLGVSDLLQRREAWQRISRALDLDHNNPFYLLELGRIRLKTPLLRIDAERLFGRALKAAEERKDPKVLADVLWELGQIDERRYQSVANRHMFTGPSPAFDAAVAMNDWHYTPDFLAQQARAVPDAGELDFRKAEYRYRGALAAWPGHACAAHGLMGLLYERGRHEEMVRLATELRAAQGSEPRLWFSLGLALHRLDRDREAEQAFYTALARSTPEDRTSILDLQDVLRPKDADEYKRLTDAERLQVDSTFWALADPVKLTGVNEARVEFLSRIAYSDLRFSAAEFGSIGWKTDRGTVVLRYGEPPVVATFAPVSSGVTDAYGNDSDAVGRVTTVWWYPSTKLRFVFVGPPAMNSARFAAEFRSYAADARFVTPLRFDNIERLTHVDSVSMQVVRFRPVASAQGARAGAEVLFFADLPTSRMLKPLDLAQSSIETGLFVSDPRRRDVVARRDTSLVRVAGDDAVSARTWSQHLAPGGYVYRVEAREPGSGRSARAQSPLSIDPFPPTTLTMSDLLVASGLTAKAGSSSIRSYNDILVRPNASMTFRRGDTLHVYWENYGITPDAERNGKIRVNLALRADKLDRGQALHARVLGGISDAVGLSAEGENQVALQFDRTVAVDAEDRVANHLALDLGSVPFASYTLELTVTDLTSGRKVVQQRVITVPRS